MAHSIDKAVCWRVSFISKNEFNPARFRRDIAGVKRKVPLAGHKPRIYVNLDNAASTPALIPVLKEVRRFTDYYAGVHRGTGYKSLFSTRAYEDSRQVIGSFVKADSSDAVIFVKNTTEAINKLSHRLRLDSSDMVMVTDMEHHSNDLPWRGRRAVAYARVDEQGRLDFQDLEQQLKRCYPCIKLLGVCGASNVTGHINDIHRLASLAHEYGARILVDGAQLVPHRPMTMKSRWDPAHIDFLAFSGHKIYAPYGAGVLIGPRSVFEAGFPEYSGGGTIRIVKRREVLWADTPEKEEAGSPNVLGVFGLARTLEYIRKGFGGMCRWEEELAAYAWKKLRQIKGVALYGGFPRVAVISFNLSGLPAGLVGSALCFEAGIGVRTGCFCAQNYVRKLLGVAENDIDESGENDQPGMIRISMAAYNTRQEIDYLYDWLERISENKNAYREKYVFSPVYNIYLPRS